MQQPAQLGIGIKCQVCQSTSPDVCKLIGKVLAMPMKVWIRENKMNGFTIRFDDAVEYRLFNWWPSVQKRQSSAHELRRKCRRGEIPSLRSILTKSSVRALNSAPEFEGSLKSHTNSWRCVILVPRSPG